MPLHSRNVLCARSLAAMILLAGCGSSAAPTRYGFVALLGNDTVSIESVTRTGNRLTSDEVDRFPRVRRRHTEIRLASDGSIRHLEMDIRTPSEPPQERLRHVVADVSKKAIRIVKTDSTGVVRINQDPGGMLAMPQLEQMYSLTDLYFAAAFASAPSTPVGGTIRLRQYYIDREFDRFSLHRGVVRILGNGRASLSHDWLSGTATATFDSAHRMLTYSGAGTTYKVEVRRLTDSLPDVEAIGARFAAEEAAKGGPTQLSVRDTARGVIGHDTISVDYGRPLMRGRVLLGNIVRYGDVWRTGANAATQFTATAPMTLAGMQLAPGTYTLWTVPTKSEVDLIVNTQYGQWGTEYNPKYDLGRRPLVVGTMSAPVEEFTMSIVPGDARHGTMVLEWGSFRWTAPIVVQ
ncbi:MAG TPA: DUF2911 domain-containing protein [Gemmatimonadales bacterium]